MELLKKANVANKMKSKRKKTKPFTEYRVMTRKIIRNKLKFEFKKMGYPHVNKNFKAIIKSMDGEKLENLIDM